MAKKDKMIEALNALTKPYNLQVSISPGKDIFSASVVLTIMDEVKVIDGKTVQPSHRIVSTSAMAPTIDEAKKAALTEALQFAGVI